MNNHPAISVLLTAYNCEKYIDEALDSLQKQTFRDFEIIMVDDGSTDSTKQHMQDFADQHPGQKIQIVSVRNGGAGAARNAGMKYATGSFWIFLDADDVYQSDLLQKLYLGCTEHHAQISVVHSWQLDTSTNSLIEKDESITPQFLPQNNPFCPKDAGDTLFCALRGWAWDKLISAELIRNNHLSFMEIRTSNDLTFTYLALACANKIYISDYCGYIYRVNNNQSVSSSRIRYWDAFYQAMVELKSQLMARKLYQVYRNAYLNWAMDFICWQIMSLPASEAQYQKYTLLHEYGIRDLDFSQISEDKVLYSFAFNLVHTIERKDYFTYLTEQNQYKIEEQQRKYEEIIQKKDNLIKQKEDQLQELEQLREECKNLQHSITEIYDSLTWKVGDVLLHIPKKIRNRKRKT